MAKKTTTDLIIVGGGLAGLTAACVLGSYGFKIVCLDREAIPQTLRADFDGRTTAVSNGSQKILAEGDVWTSLEKLSCPIRKIEILDGDSPVLLDFLSEEVGGESFGWIVENRDLRASLLQRVATLKNVTHVSGRAAKSFAHDKNKISITDDTGHVYEAALVIGADGRNSIVRQWLDIPAHSWMYNQTAVVCCVEHENPHHNVAVEHFHDQGPFAILPMKDAGKTHRSALVWTLEGKSPTYLNCSEDVFNAAIQTRFPQAYGEVKLIGQRFSYPLGLQHAHSYIGERMILIAEAAHAMHPIAGQGLNMGMRDIGELSDILLQARKDKIDFGTAEILEKFQQRRRFDTFAMMAATDALNKLFSNKLLGLGLIRRLGVRAIQKIPAAKQFFMSQAMGTAGLVPDKMKRQTKTRK